ncbi:DUF4254 domain-containing protein [Nocardia carnea]|uniref:DUF4254 domain-containing protein n=1 Tax=Nocardia carnea TaxID=37328 RepID=UPI002456C428|nr:DUF4254 domain-containing protein [Nocardia carnea]
MTLPTERRILTAVRSWDLVCTDDHPVLLCAQDLTCLHTQLLDRRHTADQHHLVQQRCAATREIDAWVHTTVPMNQRARLHTENLGNVIDRLAQRSALIDASGDTTPQEFTYLWNGLLELIVGYRHLSEDLYLGTRRLPSPAHSLGTP